MLAEQTVRLHVDPEVTLEGRLALPPTAAGGVVICHPHPLYGGDMDNPVVVRGAEVCAAQGMATLRFNFRGVGQSTGAHAGGRGELADVGTALDHLASALDPRRPIALAGYSFGAVVSAEVAPHRPGLAGLALIAPPAVALGQGRLDGLGTFGKPLLIVAGSADEHCPPEALDRVERALPQAQVSRIPGANHFFFGRLYPLGEVLGAWAGRVLQEAGSR